MVCLTPLGRLLMVQKELRCRTGNCFFDPKKHFGTTLVFPCYTATKPHWTHVNGQEEHTHKSSSSPVGEIPLISSTSTPFHAKKLLPNGPSHSYGTFLYGVKKRNVRQDWELIFDTIKLNPNHSFLFLDALPPNHVGHKSLGEKLTATNRAECLSERCPRISSTSKRFHIKNGLPMVCLTPLVSLLIVQKMRLRIGK